MKPVKKNDPDTKTRILQSACEVFAEKGYRDATIAEICEKAQANIAAVNYHFRGKETLYAEAWRLAFQRSIDTYPADGGIAQSAPPEDRLLGRILSIMRRITDPKSYEFEIVHKELANPTGLLSEVMQNSIDPIRKGFFELIRELLGEKASDLQVQLCQMSIRAQCFDLMLRARRHKKPLIRQTLPGVSLLDLDLEVIAAHILKFSLAGIREIRRQIESESPHEH